jgi:hypothetical protein
MQNILVNLIMFLFLFQVSDSRTNFVLRKSEAEEFERIPGNVNHSL